MAPVDRNSPPDTDKVVQDIFANVQKGAVPAAEALKIASSLTPEMRVFIAEKLEADIGRMTDCTTAEVREECVKRAKENLLVMEERRRQGVVQGYDAEAAMLMALLCDFVFKNKGEKAIPFIQLYEEEAAQFSAEEKEIPENHATAFCTALENTGQWTQIQQQRMDEKAEKIKAQERERALAANETAKRRLEKLKSHGAPKGVKFKRGL